MTVNYETYAAEKKSFFKKHDCDWNVSTSSMDEYDRYTKTYSFEDGAQWIELMAPVTEIVEIEHRGIKFNAECKMMRTEYWTTEFGSRYYYEKY